MALEHSARDTITNKQIFFVSIVLILVPLHVRAAAGDPVNQPHCQLDLLIQPNLSDDRLNTYLGTQSFVLKRDVNGNRLYLSPSGRGLLVTSHGALHEWNLRRRCDVTYLGAKEGQNHGLNLKDNEEQLRYIIDSSPQEIRFELVNTKPISYEDYAERSKTTLVSPTAKAGLPIVSIESADQSGYSKVAWETFMGKEVNVGFSSKNGSSFVVPQFVTNINSLEKMDPPLAEITRQLLLAAEKSISDQGGIAHESGIWLLEGQKGTYTSSFFHGAGFASITSDIALRPLMEIVQEALKRRDSSPMKLTLIHTHPLSGAPLSSRDHQTLQALAEQIDLEKGDELQMLAVPIPDRGKRIFSTSIKGN